MLRSCLAWRCLDVRKRKKRESKKEELRRLSREQSRDDTPRARTEGHASLTMGNDGSGDSFLSWFKGSVTPIGGHGLNMRSLTTILRVRHCLSFLPPEQAALLWQRYVEHRTLDDLATQHGITRQAVFQRGETSKAAFVVAVTEHWNDPIDLGKLEGHT